MSRGIFSEPFHDDDGQPRFLKNYKLLEVPVSPNNEAVEASDLVRYPAGLDDVLVAPLDEDAARTEMLIDARQAVERAIDKNPPRV